MSAREGTDTLLKLERALAVSHGKFSMETLSHDLGTGNAVWLNVHDSAVVLKVETYPTGLRVLNVFAVAGDMQDVFSAEPMVMEIARYNNCERLELHGRKGWERVLRDRGWKFESVTMHKVVP